MTLESLGKLYLRCDAAESELLVLDERAEDKIKTIFGDEGARAYAIVDASSAAEKRKTKA